MVASTSPNRSKTDDIVLPPTSSKAARSSNKFRYASTYDWYLQNWSSPKIEKFPVKGRGGKKDVTFRKSRGFPFDGKDFTDLIDKMVELPVRDSNNSYLDSIELNSEAEYNLKMKRDRKKRIHQFNPATDFLQSKIGEQFELPEEVAEWVDRIEELDIEKWIRWLNYIPDLLPDFGLPENLEDRINQALNARALLSTCEE